MPKFSRLYVAEASLSCLAASCIQRAIAEFNMAHKGETARRTWQYQGHTSRTVDTKF